MEGHTPFSKETIICADPFVGHCDKALPGQFIFLCMCACVHVCVCVCVASAKTSFQDLFTNARMIMLISPSIMQKIR